MALDYSNKTLGTEFIKFLSDPKKNYTKDTSFRTLFASDNPISYVKTGEIQIQVDNNIGQTITFALICYDCSGHTDIYKNGIKVKKPVLVPYFGIKVADLFKIFRHVNYEVDFGDKKITKMYKNILKIDPDYSLCVPSSYGLNYINTNHSTINEFINSVVLFPEFNNLNIVTSNYIVVLNSIFSTLSSIAMLEIIQKYMYGSNYVSPTSTENIISFGEPIKIMDLGEKYCKDKSEYHMMKRILNKKKVTNKDITPYIYKSFKEFDNHVNDKSFNMFSLNSCYLVDINVSLFKDIFQVILVNHKVSGERNGFSCKCSYCVPNINAAKKRVIVTMKSEYEDYLDAEDDIYSEDEEDDDEMFI
jgi:hypothetical protein